MVKNWVFLNFIIKVRGGRHSTWEKHAVSKYSHLLSPRSHWQILPTSHLLTGLKVENCTLLWALCCLGLFSVKMELKLERKYCWVFISELERDCAHFVDKKYLQADLWVNCAYRREYKQCLCHTKRRGMCKKSTSKTRQLVVLLLIHVNRKPELCTLVTWV